MENKIYRIVEISFRYNDEYYSPDNLYGRFLSQNYQDLQQAEIALKEMVRKDLYAFIDNDLWHIQDISQLETKLIEKFGENYNKTSYPDLSLEQAYNLMVEADMVFYDIIETNNTNDICYSAVWFNHSQKFFRDFVEEIYDKYGNCRIYNADPTHIFRVYPKGVIHDNRKHIYNFIRELPQILQGSLADLTDSPTLLQHYIQQYNELSYDSEKQQLNIQAKDYTFFYDDPDYRQPFEMWKGLNALLKQPIFEIRYISDDE